MHWETLMFTKSLVAWENLASWENQVAWESLVAWETSVYEGCLGAIAIPQKKPVRNVD